MRADSYGFFWQDLPQEKARGERIAVVRPMPAIPDTGWRPPAEFPRLEAAKVLSVDCETKDPNLLEQGPGNIRKDGHIVGISVGTDDGMRWYFPMRHEVGGMNMDADQVLRWAADELGRPHQLKIGANIGYDLGWLASEGVEVAGKFIDVQYQEALLDENAKSYSLENIAQRHLGEGKISNALYEWCAQAYGGGPDSKQRANIYRAPASLVGPYAESDADLPMRIAAMQSARLAAEQLQGVADLENALIPMMLAMRQRGVRVDTGAASALDSRLGLELAKLNAELGVAPWASADIAARCNALGIAYPKTAAGNPSFTAIWLKAQQHPFLATLLRARLIDKMKGTFISGHVLGHLIGDRIHCQFHQLKGDDFGTVSGRFSSSDPNLQNIPSRDDELAPLIRALFLPDPDNDWVRFDWSQIEFRLLVHYARGKGAAEARRKFNEDPTTDFHNMVNDWVFGGDPAMRKPSKNINFGLVYGMGKPKLARSLGRSEEAAEALFALYHSTMPFVKETFDAAAALAANRGYIKTLLNRRRRFDLWEPRDFKKAKEADIALSREAAMEMWGPSIRRAYTHAALNGLLQGGAADIMKLAMVDIWQSGVCDVLGAPLCIVHDEICFSAPRTPEADDALRHARHIMEHCVTLRVPLLAEREDGPSWGDLQKYTA